MRLQHPLTVVKASMREGGRREQDHQGHGEGHPPGLEKDGVWAPTFHRVPRTVAGANFVPGRERNYIEEMRIKTVRYLKCWGLIVNEELTNLRRFKDRMTLSPRSGTVPCWSTPMSETKSRKVRKILRLEARAQRLLARYERRHARNDGAARKLSTIVRHRLVAFTVAPRRSPAPGWAE